MDIMTGIALRKQNETTQREKLLFASFIETFLMVHLYIHTAYEW